MNHRLSFLVRCAVAASVVTLLSGCGEAFFAWRDGVRKQASETVDNVGKKVQEVSDQVEKTRAAVEQKVNDVNDAVKKVGDAADAVKKVTQ